VGYWNNWYFSRRIEKLKPRFWAGGAFVALLLGHIELFGRDNPDQAAGFYEQVLTSQPQETLAELAQQGLERSLQSSSATSQPEPSPAAESLPEILRDSFLTDQPAASGSPAPLSTRATAMPWLEPTTPEPTPPPEPTPQPTSEPTPAPTEIPNLEAGLVPESTPEPLVTEEDPLEVLAGCLLRVKINLPDPTAVKVQQEPSRPSWIQQLRALVGRR
jgi:hypothetical protein